MRISLAQTAKHTKKGDGVLCLQVYVVGKKINNESLQ